MDSPRAVAVTGSSGLVGSALCDAFATDGVRVLRLVRSRSAADGTDAVFWKPSSGEIDAAALEGVDLVFHLGGKGIADDRWTPAVKDLIRSSRVDSTRLLAQTLAGLSDKPRTLVTASAIGYYGDRGDTPLDESASPGRGFLARTCVDWEDAGAPAWEAGLRVVQTRIGMVLSKRGGALAKMLPVFRKGMGAVLGSGDQVVSWIALPDLIRVLRFVGDVESINGAVNAVAPGAVTNREFTKKLGEKLGKPTFLPAPTFALKMAMGEMAEEVLLSSARVVPRKLSEAGFDFECPTLGVALDRVLGQGG
ncbi:TIGR01777 family oxidoreductase [Botrimarina sp.]|uniref:TIGR01777 family oxidoreductase n=1 Tax=Botrimarina sp. TaxID=2795802 RepID=UPI0032EE0677